MEHSKDWTPAGAPQLRLMIHGLGKKLAAMADGSDLAEMIGDSRHVAFMSAQIRRRGRYWIVSIPGLPDVHFKNVFVAAALLTGFREAAHQLKKVDP